MNHVGRVPSGVTEPKIIRAKMIGNRINHVAKPTDKQKCEISPYPSGMPANGANIGATMPIIQLPLTVLWGVSLQMIRASIKALRVSRLKMLIQKPTFANTGQWFDICAEINNMPMGIVQ